MPDIKPTADDMKSIQQNMYGCSQSDLDEMLNEQFDYREQFMLCASMLSDAQEVMNNTPETGRQFINRAKYVLFKLQDEFTTR